MSEIMTLIHTVPQWGIVAMLAKGGAMMLPLLAASVTSLTVQGRARDRADGGASDAARTLPQPPRGVGLRLLSVLGLWGFVVTGKLLGKVRLG